MESCVNVLYGILVQGLKKSMHNKHPGVLKSWLRGVLQMVFKPTNSLGANSSGIRSKVIASNKTT